MRLECTVETAAEVAAQVRRTIAETVDVAPILQAVRERGDEALREYEARFGDDDPVVVGGDELAAALDALDPDVRAGLKRAAANVRAVAEAGLDDEAEVTLPEGQTIRLREVPVRRAAVYAPGGRHPYPSSVIMGAVTARAAGVDEVVVAAPGHPVILAAAALCGADEVYRMGGAQAIAALAYGTETIRPVDVIVGPGSLWVQEAKRQVSGFVGIDGFAGPSDLTIIASEGADPEPLRLDLMAQAEHGEGSLVVAVSDDEALLDALEVGVTVQADHRSRAGLRRGAGPRAPPARRRGRRAARPARAQRRLPVRRHRVRHRVRRLRGGFEPHAAHRRRRPLRLRAQCPPLPPPHGRGARGARRAGPGARRSADRPRRGLRAPRRFHGDPRESAVPMTRTAEITRTTGETDVKLTLGLDGTGAGSRNTGVGFLDHMLDLLGRHGRLDLEVQVTGDLQTGAHHTVEDTGIVFGQALDKALGDRRGIARYGHAIVPMDESRALCAIDLSGRPFAAITGFERLPAGDIAGFEHELAEEFFRAIASAARLTLHLDLQAGTNAHHMIEACFKAFARALRVAVAVDPSETGVPSTKGTLT